MLKVPKTNFNLTRQYDELYGVGPLVSSNDKIADDLVVLYAAQNIRFQMDERGVKLRSEANMQLGCSGGRPCP